MSGYSEETFSDGKGNYTEESGEDASPDPDPNQGGSEEDDSDSDEAYAQYERDWNAEFQSVLRKEDSFGKWDSLSSLSRDFVYAAKV